MTTPSPEICMLKYLCVVSLFPLAGNHMRARSTFLSVTSLASRAVTSLRQTAAPCHFHSLQLQSAGMFQMGNQQGPTVQHRELCSILCGSLDGRGVGGEWIHIYVWLSTSTVHLKLIATLFISYTPI